MITKPHTFMSACCRLRKMIVSLFESERQQEGAVADTTHVNLILSTAYYYYYDSFFILFLDFKF